jgi:protein-L-isoaspartate O-methyltransferase
MCVKTKTQALQQAEELERDLTLLTKKVALALQKPASRRDPSDLATAWSEVTCLRPQMQAIGRFLRKIDKPVRKGMISRDYRAQRNLYERARNFARLLREWDEMDHIVHRHLDPDRKPLLPVSQVPGNNALLTQIYTALHRLANPNPQGQFAQDHGCFSDIALPIQNFDILMSAAYRICLAQNPQRGLRFLDVGCGGGTKVFAATRFFRQADGIEYDQGYADAARSTLQTIGASTSKIFHADATTFEAYADYDVIYFYRPLQTDALLDMMEQHIIGQARPGTILVAPYDSSFSVRPGMNCAQVEGPIFVTGTDQASADQLKIDAEATGTDILGRSEDRVFDAGYWTPILDAASFNGAG